MKRRIYVPVLLVVLAVCALVVATGCERSDPAAAGKVEAVAPEEAAVASIQDLHPADIVPPSDPDDCDAEPPQFGPDTLVQCLIDVGFSHGNLAGAESLLRDHVEFQTEVRRRNDCRRTMLVFYVLFKDTDTAREFVALRERSLAQWEPSIQERVAAAVNVFRRRNFVGIVVAGEPPLRDYIARKWGLSPEEMNL